MGQRDINIVIRVFWSLTDGRWTVDRPEVRVDPIPIPPLPVADGKESQSKTSVTSEPLWGFQVAAIKGQKRAQAHSDLCRVRTEEGLRITPPGAAKIGSKKRGDK